MYQCINHIQIYITCAISLSIDCVRRHYLVIYLTDNLCTYQSTNRFYVKQVIHLTCTTIGKLRILYLTCLTISKQNLRHQKYISIGQPDQCINQIQIYITCPISLSLDCVTLHYVTLFTSHVQQLASSEFFFSRI